MGGSRSQKICRFHIESGSYATLYSRLFLRRVWLHAILQDPLFFGARRMENTVLVHKTEFPHIPIELCAVTSADAI
jgi:hypothetical protein